MKRLARDMAYLIVFGAACFLAGAIISSFATTGLLDTFATAETWTENDGTGSVVSGKYQFVMTSTVDPYLGKDVTNFAASNNTLTLLYKGYANGPTHLDLYWQATTGACVGSYNGSCNQAFLNVLNTDGNWRMVTVSITDADWAGTIDKLRIDWAAQSATGTILVAFLKLTSALDTTGPTFGGADLVFDRGPKQFRSMWSAATDDADGVPQEDLGYEVCVEPTAGGCAASWSVAYSFYGPISGTITEYEDTTSSNRDTRFIVVRASDWVNLDTNTREFRVGVPLAPTAVSAVDAAEGTGTQIALTWTVSGSASVTEQRLYRALGPSGTYSLVTSFANNTTASYTDTDLIANNTYYYVLRAYDGRESPDSTVVSAAPLASNIPTAVVVTNGLTQAALDWADVGSATGYKVFRCSSTPCDGSNLTRVLVASPVASAYTNTGLSGNTLYYFRIVAVGGWGDSADSREVIGVPESSAPLLATGYTATDLLHSIIGGPYHDIGRVTDFTGPDKPIIFVEGSLFYLFYHSGNDVKYVSDGSGLSFATADSAVVTVNGLSSDAGTKAPLQVIKDGATYYIIGVGRPTAQTNWKGFWVASSSTLDGPYTALNSGNLVLSLHSRTWRDAIINGAWVVKVGSSWRMCYGGESDSSQGYVTATQTGVFFVGCADSTDLVTWKEDESNPVMSGRGTGSGLEGAALELLSLTYVDGQYIMLYEHGNTRRGDHISYFGFSMATSVDGRTWNKVPLGSLVLPPGLPRGDSLRTFIVHPAFVYDVSTGSPVIIEGSPDTVRICYVDGTTTTLEPYEGGFSTKDIRCAARSMTTDYRYIWRAGTDLHVSEGTGTINFRQSLEPGLSYPLSVGDGYSALRSEWATSHTDISVTWDNEKSEQAYYSLPGNATTRTINLVPGQDLEVFLTLLDLGASHDARVRFRALDSTNYTELQWTANTVAVNHIIAGADNNATSVATPTGTTIVHLFIELVGTSLKYYVLKECDWYRNIEKLCVHAYGSTTLSSVHASSNMAILNGSTTVALGATDLTIYRAGSAIYDWFSVERVEDAGSKASWLGVDLFPDQTMRDDTVYVVKLACRNALTEPWSVEVSDIATLPKCRYLKIKITATKIPWEGAKYSVENGVGQGLFFYAPGNGLRGYRIQYLIPLAEAVDTGGVL